MTELKDHQSIETDPIARQGASPNRTGARALMDRLLVTDSQFNAFCVDIYPAVYKQFSSSMTRVEKTNLLLSMTENIDRLCEDIKRFSTQSLPIMRRQKNHFIMTIVLAILTTTSIAYFAIVRSNSNNSIVATIPSHPHQSNQSPTPPGTHAAGLDVGPPVPSPSAAQGSPTIIDNGSRTYIYGNGKINITNLNSAHGTVKQNILIK